MGDATRTARPGLYEVGYGQSIIQATAPARARQGSERDGPLLSDAFATSVMARPLVGPAVGIHAAGPSTLISGMSAIIMPPRGLLERFARIVQLLRERLKEVLLQLETNARKVASQPEDPAASRFEVKAHYVKDNMDQLVLAFMMLGFTTDVGPNPPPSSSAFHQEVGRLLDGLGACPVSRREFGLGLLDAAQRQINARAEEREAAGVDSKTNESEVIKEEAVLAAVKESLGTFTDLRPRKE